MGLFDRCADRINRFGGSWSWRTSSSENDVPSDTSDDYPDLFSDYEALKAQSTEAQASAADGHRHQEPNGKEHYPEKFSSNFILF